jgi:AcrR family transcriptional regulator
MSPTSQDRSSTGIEARSAPRLRRTERRDQILVAATSVFAEAGFEATSLDDVAAAAGISRVILYRHFESKADLYRAVLERVCTRMSARVGLGDYGEDAIPNLVRAAGEDPDGFRLLFRHAAREPEFRDLTEVVRAAAYDTALRELHPLVADRRWRRWAGQLVPAVAVEAVIAWLDAGQPDPDTAPGRIGRAIQGVIDAARADNDDPRSVATLTPSAQSRFSGPRRSRR